MSNTLRLPSRVLYFGLLSGLIAGCGGGGGGAELKGKISYGGQPVSGARVTLLAPSGKTFAATTTKEGTFVIGHVDEEGEMKVRIETGKPPPNPMEASMEKMMKDPRIGASAKKLEKSDVNVGPYDKATGGSGQELPKKYSDYDKSGLTWTVSKDKASRTKEFNLTD